MIEQIENWLQSTEPQPTSGWDFTQDERDWAVETVRCPFCDMPVDHPCIVMEPYKHDSGAEYTHYVHLDRMLAVFS